MIPSRKLTARTPVNLTAKIVSKGETHPGFIQNVSEDGIGYLLESVFEVDKDFAPKKKLSINLQIPSGETLNLNCEIIWCSRKSPDDKRLSIGLKIIKPSQKYKKFAKKLKTEYFRKKRDYLHKKHD
jgi:hypothetical protein